MMDTEQSCNPLLNESLFVNAYIEQVAKYKRY